MGMHQVTGGNLQDIEHLFQLTDEEKKRGAFEVSQGGNSASEDPTTPLSFCPPELEASFIRSGGIQTMYPYRDEAGRLLGYACRMKQNKPIFGKGKTGSKILYQRPCISQDDPMPKWYWRGWRTHEGLRPIYGLDRLAERPGNPVIICEGEKAADAAQLLFPDLVAITSMEGASRAARTDWRPLRGRDVVVWPDNDAPGREYARSLYRALSAVKPQSLRVVDIPTNWPLKHDLADQMPYGVTEETLRAMLTSARQASEAQLAPSFEIADFIPSLDFEEIPENAFDAMAYLNERFFLVNRGGSVKIGRAEMLPDGSRRSAYFMGKQDFTDMLNKPVIIPAKNEGEEPKTETAAKMWLSVHNEKRVVASGEAFVSPDHLTPSGMLNTFGGFAIQPDIGDHEEWLKFIREVICNHDAKVYYWLIAWMAAVIQDPARPAETAVVLLGSQGVGKGTFASFFERVFGAAHYRKFTGVDHIVGRFNDHLASCVVAFLDEVSFAGNQKAAAQLKSMLTSETLSIETKGGAVQTVPSHLHAIFASNDRHAVRLEKDDRRYLVLEVSDTYANNQNFFNAFTQKRLAGGDAALLAYLVMLDIPQFLSDHGISLRMPPMTSAKMEQQRASASSLSLFLEEIGDTEEFIDWPDMNAPAAINRQGHAVKYCDVNHGFWPERVAVSALRTQYEAWCKERGYRPVGDVNNQRRFIGKLRSHGLYVDEPSQRMRLPSPKLGKHYHPDLSYLGRDPEGFMVTTVRFPEPEEYRAMIKDKGISQEAPAMLRSKSVGGMRV